MGKCPLCASVFQHTKTHSLHPKWLSSFLILVRLRPAHRTIVRVVVSMTLKIENTNYSETPPEVAMSKVFLMMKLILESIWVLAFNI